MLIQQDTSTHDWVRSACRALVASIDDANNDVVYAQFFPVRRDYSQHDCHENHHGNERLAFR